MISKSVVFRNVIVYITISSRSFVFSKSRVEVSTSLSNVHSIIYSFSCILYFKYHFNDLLLDVFTKISKSSSFSLVFRSSHSSVEKVTRRGK